MLVRIRSKTGTARYEVSPNDDVSVLLNKILADTPNADPSSLTLSQQPRGGETSASELSGDVQGLGIKHGDLLFVAYEEAAADGDTEAAAAAVPAPAASHGARLNGAAVPAPELSDVASSILQGNASKTAVSAAGKSNKPWQHVVEDLVDTHWENADGKIYRKKDARMCKHGEKSMCDHCMPLEPYDAVYKEEHKIKHLSFHSYLRKRDITTNRSTGASSNTFIPPLSEPNYKVAVPCPSGSHPSWPAGICTKCQPSAVTLALQQYRMVDHVEFASPAIIESLLEFWRRTGSQRFGWLLGRYETYDIVPMGVKAVVEAIHEPPQEGELDGVRLGLPWEDESKVESLAQMCGLRVVGMIFTDLTPDTSSDEVKKQGKVLAKRHKDSYFLSSLEAIFAAKQAHRHANPSRFSDTGKFGSKFVTCVVTGDREGNVAVEAYQVSDQAMAMVEADMIEASVEPGVVRIREDTSEEKDTSNTNIKKRYIPDVFYTYKNQYNLQVKEVAKPCFPTDYLLVSLTNGFPTSANPLFVAAAATAFPIENRAGLHDQSIAKASVSLNKLVRALPDNMPESSGSKVKGKGKATDVEAFENLGKWLSDWHLLAYLDTVGIFDKSDVQLLAKVATTRDPASLVALLRTPSWQTFVTIAGEQAGSGSGGPGSALKDAHSFPTDADGFPIIPDDHDMMRTDTPRTGKSSFGNDADDFHSIPDVDNPPDGAGGGGEGAAGGGGGGVITCPHCTYENPAGSVDCEICSLPLQG